MNVALANGTTVTLTSAGSNDVFVIKLDSTGGAVWAQRFGGAGADVGYGIAVNASSGSTYTTGQFQGSVDVTLVNGTTVTLTSAGSTDVFVITLESTGGAVWAQRFGGTGNAIGRGIVVDAPSGFAYTTGYFQGSMDLALADGTSITLNSYDLISVFLLQIGDALPPPTPTSRPTSAPSAVRRETLAVVLCNTSHVNHHSYPVLP
jgi:hypothetical protein